MKARSRRIKIRIAYRLISLLHLEERKLTKILPPIQYCSPSWYPEVRNLNDVILLYFPLFLLCRSTDIAASSLS
jgi:hypothetical protein